VPVVFSLATKFTPNLATLRKSTSANKNKNPKLNFKNDTDLRKNSNKNNR
jgi:hypothetical protein